MTICTWKDCTQPADHPQYSECLCARRWAHLCAEHDAMLLDAVRAAVRTKDTALLTAWALAQAQRTPMPHWGECAVTPPATPPGAEGGVP